MGFLSFGYFLKYFMLFQDWSASLILTPFELISNVWGKQINIQRLEFLKSTLQEIQLIADHKHYYQQVQEYQ